MGENYNDFFEMMNNDGNYYTAITAEAFDGQFGRQADGKQLN